MDALGQTGYEVRGGGGRGRSGKKKKRRNSFCFSEFHFRAERKKEKKRGRAAPTRGDGAQRSGAVGGAGRAASRLRPAHLSR